MPSAQIETPFLSQVNWWGGVELVPGWEQGPWASGLKGGDWGQARPKVVDMFCLCVCAMPVDGHTDVWTHRCVDTQVHACRCTHTSGLMAPGQGPLAIHGGPSAMHLLSIYCVPVTFQAHHVGKLIDCDDYLHFPDGKGEAPGGQETCFRSQLLGRGGVGI